MDKFSVGRRRFSAILAGISLMPTLALSQDEVEKLRCSASKTVFGGFQNFNYHLENKTPKSISATIRVDLNVYTKERVKEIDIMTIQDTQWSQNLVADADRRAKYFDPDVEGMDKEKFDAVILDLKANAEGLATRGWMDFTIVNRPQDNQLYISDFSVFMPPIGNDVILTGEDKALGIVILADNMGVGAIPFELKDDLFENGDLASIFRGSGVEPWGTINIKDDPTFFQRLTGAITGDHILKIQVLKQDRTVLLEGKPSFYFDWSALYKSLLSLEPKAASKVKAAQAGDVSMCEEDGCFLTTATMKAVGLNDDCFELQTLRKYRDVYLKKIEGGKAMIREYYVNAPMIVSKINRRDDADKIWNVVYAKYIIPSVILASFKMNKAALWVYKRLYRKLSEI